MPRRAKVERRVVPPDPRYGSELVSRVVNKVMKRGKKGVAERIVYGALDIIQERTGRDPVDVFQQAIHNATPIIEVKPRRVGGATSGAGADRARAPAVAGDSLAAAVVAIAIRTIDGGEAGGRAAGCVQQHWSDDQATRRYAPHG